MLIKSKAATLKRLTLMENRGSYNPSEKMAIIDNLYFKKQPATLINALNLQNQILPFSEVVKRKQEFQPFKLGDNFKGAWNTYWLYIEVTLPVDWDSYKEIHFIVNTNSEGMIYDTNGVCLQGLTGDQGVAHRIWYAIKRPEDGRNQFNQARVASYYVEVACTNLFGTFNNGNMYMGINKNIEFSLAECGIGAFDREMWNLYWSFDVLTNMANEITNPQTNAGDMAMVVANKICNALNFSDRNSITQCNNMALDFLKKTNSDSQHQIYACGHCHIDMAWLWPFSETRRKGARSFCSQLELMSYYKDFKFTASTACLYWWIQQDYPELFERLVKNGSKSFIPVGGTWVEFDGYVPSGESMARQFLLGQRFFKKYFGKYCTVFFLPDTFGYSSQLPQIAKKSGIDYFITQKLSWNFYDKFPHSTFNWKGIDGTEILTHFPPADTYCSNCEVSEILMSHTNFKDKGRSNSSVLLFGIGDGGGGPQPEHIEKLIRMKDVYGLPKVKFADTNEFFENIKADSLNLMKWTGELFLELHNGSYTSQAANKRYNRICEILLFKTELFGSLAYIIKKDKAAYPSHAIDTILPDMYLFQFHDVLPGTCIKNVYDVTDQMYPTFVSSFGNSIAKSRDVISEQLLSKSKPKLMILKDHILTPSEIKPSNSAQIGFLTLPLTKSHILYNATAFTRTEMIEINGVKQVVSDIPAYGYRIINDELIASKACKSSVYKVGDNIVLKNQYIEITFTPEGVISSIKDFETQLENNPLTMKEVIKPTSTVAGGNALFLWEDLPIYWDAWDIWPYYMEKGVQIKAKSYTLVQSIDEPAIIFQYQISPLSTIEIIASLRSFSRRIDFASKVDWHETHKLLRVYFPMNLISDYATFDVQFGTLKRTTKKNTTWELAMYEVCGHHFMDFSDGSYGAALLNNCKYGYSIDGSLMGMSLLKSAKAPSQSTDMGMNLFTYSFMPHRGTYVESDVLKEARCLNSPIEVSDISTGPGISIQSESFIKINKPNVELDCFKLAEGAKDSAMNALIIRMHEAYGDETVFNCEFAFSTLLGYIGDIKVSLCNILEEKMADDHVIISNNGKGSLLLRLQPFESATFMVELNF